ncbi:MAG: MATE family efflux transporter [Ruminococcaceae bacterium]|nr:MATE family efflux transporter [Oscillospiraceae bacterium]
MKLGTNLTEGPILKKFVLFVIPLIFTGFLQQLYNAADTVVVGRFASETALAEVGATSSMSALIITLFMGLAVGTNVVCASFFGAENKEGLERALHTSILLAIIIGIPLVLVGWFGAESFLELIGTPDDIIDGAALYMKLYFLGVPANLVFNFGAAVIRAMGNTKKPFYILAVSGIVNVILNLICVIVFKLGVVGVAIGTVAAQIISALWVIAIFTSKDAELKLRFSKLRIYKKEFLKILAIGVPSGVNGILFSLSNVFVQSAINSFGKITVAAHSVAWNYMAFSNLLVSASEQGTVSFVGQNMGAKKYDRVKSVIKKALTVSCITTILFSAFIVWQSRGLLGIFTTDNRVVEAGLIQLYIAISVYVLYVPDMIIGGALRGMGKSVLPTAINILGICGLRVAWIAWIWPLNPTLEMVYYSYGASWLISGIAMTMAYLFVRRKIFGEIRTRNKTE